MLWPCVRGRARIPAGRPRFELLETHSCASVRQEVAGRGVEAATRQQKGPRGKKLFYFIWSYAVREWAFLVARPNSISILFI